MIVPKITILFFIVKKNKKFLKNKYGLCNNINYEWDNKKSEFGLYVRR